MSSIAASAASGRSRNPYWPVNWPPPSAGSADSHHRMRRALLSVYVGSVAEILVFVLLIPNNSTTPPTRFQAALVHILLPMMSVKDTLGPVAGALPYPLSAVSGF